MVSLDGGHGRENGPAACRTRGQYPDAPPPCRIFRSSRTPQAITALAARRVHICSKVLGR